VRSTDLASYITSHSAFGGRNELSWFAKSQSSDAECAIDRRKFNSKVGDQLYFFDYAKSFTTDLLRSRENEREKDR